MLDTALLLIVALLLAGSWLEAWCRKKSKGE